MKSVKEALSIILKHARPLGVENIDLSFSLGRILAENVYSDIDIPPFDRSAMDGFAVNSKDPSTHFAIIEDIPAGKIPKKRIDRGTCARIMTGAMIPKEADRVIMAENTKLLEKNKIVILRHDNKLNISNKGEDIKIRELVLQKGSTIRPQEAAMLATVGKTNVKVLKLPEIAVISTGSELVEPHNKPKSGQIRNSNSPMLLLQLKKLGINGKYLGIAKDTMRATEKLIKNGLRHADILIITGGVSAGDYDFIYNALKKCGVKILFNRVAVKPGKPTTFGIKGRKLIFGLPGYPVSSLISFNLFVAPAIDKIAGGNEKDRIIKSIILKDFYRRDTKREQYYPVRLTKNGAVPLEFHGSGHMHALTMADGFLRIKAGIKKIKKGSAVYVRSI